MQLKERDGLYLMERYQQTGRVAAHYTPLIGPYSSKDEDTIRLHLELLRQAGVKGVIINWYGISNRYDYPVLKEAADTIIRLSHAAGMLWTLCYEDRTIDDDLSEEDQVAQLQADWEYIRDVYIEQFSGTMLRDAVTERPVFLQFGPETFFQPKTWSNMLQAVFSDISERPHLLGVDKVNPQNVLPDGGFNWPGWDLFENPTPDTIETFHNSFYDRAQSAGWYPVIGSTFPRFRDYYVQGNSPNSTPKSWWNITVPSFNGDTIAISIDAARESGADVLQAVTWNDWQEGTNFEPSAEEGYTQLLRLQEHILGWVDEDSMRNAVLAYNDLKASEWQQCDRVSPDHKLDCGTKESTEVSCEASGCCWRPSSQSGPWCFHKAPSPGVCEQPAPAVRNCTRTPEDRLCHCSTPSTEPTTYIDNVIANSVTKSPSTWKPKLAFEIVDSFGNPVKPANEVTITVQIAGGEKVNVKKCKTNKKGKCRIKLPKMNNNVDSVTISFVRATAVDAHIVYDGSSNVEYPQGCTLFSTGCPTFTILAPNQHVAVQNLIGVPNDVVLIK